MSLLMKYINLFFSFRYTKPVALCFNIIFFLILIWFYKDSYYLSEDILNITSKILKHKQQIVDLEHQLGSQSGFTNSVVNTSNSLNNNFVKYLVMLSVLICTVGVIHEYRKHDGMFLDSFSLAFALFIIIIFNYKNNLDLSNVMKLLTLEDLQLKNAIVMLEERIQAELNLAQYISNASAVKNNSYNMYLIVGAFVIMGLFTVSGFCFYNGLFLDNPLVKCFNYINDLCLWLFNIENLQTTNVIYKDDLSNLVKISLFKSNNKYQYADVFLKSNGSESFIPLDNLLKRLIADSGSYENLIAGGTNLPLEAVTRLPLPANYLFAKRPIFEQVMLTAINPDINAGIDITNFFLSNS